MASDINTFGVVSDGIDRAQFGVAPPIRVPTDPRPPPEALKYQKPSIRHVIGDNLLSVVVHPQYGIKKIRAAVKEKREATAKEHEPPNERTGDEDAPTLAPLPPFQSIDSERLEYELNEKPRFPPLRDFIHQPFTAVQSVVQDQRGSDLAENITSPEVAHGATVELVRQSDKVSAATTEDERTTAFETLVQMKQLRQDAYVRWTIDRHVRRVGRIQLLDGPPARPSLIGGTTTKNAVENWKTYARDLLKYEIETYAENYVDNNYELPRPNRKTLASSLERVVIASTPVQNVFMKLRSIARWENPSESARYMVLYFVLLFFSQITRMMILFILVKVMFQKWYPTSIDELKESICKAENSDGTATNLTDLVIQYGTRGWVDRAIENVGPELSDWLEYTADILEMARNSFCEWRNARSTAVTLIVFSAWWVLITLAPTWLLVQMIFSSVGFTFFVLTPIAVRHRRYRLLTSPWIWLMWKIPTHAEWAIARLQAEAKQHLAEQGKDETQIDTNNTETPLVIGSYSCTGGNIVVTATDVTFSPRRAADATWRVEFSNLTGIQKITEVSKGGEYEGIIFESFDGSVQRAQHVDCRNEVFSQIIGYSALPWKRTG
ncbi:hypothetical protein LTR84_009083 [Exophiala bonariae]|uniref:SUN domain-containing protein n=1 Tax=Exophiala bonariae TaxID=1690606 RepID=A0AAV9MYV9_9EURO|nr:hypothetical protein LTR84_009083 [Exophiala bonariae]